MKSGMINIQECWKCFWQATPYCPRVSWNDDAPAVECTTWLEIEAVTEVKE